jgi:polar amino acid transport system substrate-binding protein
VLCRAILAGVWVILGGLGVVSTAAAQPLRIVTYALAPYAVETPKGIDGLAVAVAREVLTPSGDWREPEMLPFARVLDALRTEPNIFAMILIRTPSRDPIMKWLGPLASTDIEFYQAANRPGPVISTMEEARQVPAIAVTQDNIHHTVLLAMGFTNLEANPTQEMNIRKLLAGRADLTPMGEVAFANSIKALGIPPEAFIRTPVLLYRTELYFALSVDIADERIALWQQRFDALVASGRMTQLRARYVPTLPALTPSTTIPAPAATGQ